MGLFGREGLISSRSISASPNDDVMDTPEGETPGARSENVESGDDGGEGGVSSLAIPGMSSVELLSCCVSLLLLWAAKRTKIQA